RDPERIVRGAVVDKHDLVAADTEPGRCRCAPCVKLIEERGRSIHRRHDRQRDRRHGIHGVMLAGERSFMYSIARGPAQKITSSAETACSKGGNGCGYSG